MKARSLLLLLLLLLLLFFLTSPAYAFKAGDYGVFCNGVTDTTEPLQAAITAARVGTNGRRLTMPEGGVCMVSNSLVIADVLGFELDGNGVQFKAVGNSLAALPLFLHQDARETVLHNFSVVASVSVPIQTVFQYENSSGAVFAPTHNQVNHVFVQCANGGCDYGIRMVQGAGGDANNDFNTFKDVTINNVAIACASIEHKQSKTNVFESFGCFNNRLGQYIISANASGSFHCINCRGGGSAVADFYIYNASDAVIIQGGNFENSTRLFVTEGPSSGAFPVTITGTRWANNFLHADGKAVIFQFSGPLTLTNNLLGVATANLAMSVYFNPLNGVGSFVSTGNYFGTTLTNPYLGVQPTTHESNLIDRNDGNGVLVFN